MIKLYNEKRHPMMFNIILYYLVQKIKFVTFIRPEAKSNDLTTSIYSIGDELEDE